MTDEEIRQRLEDLEHMLFEMNRDLSTIRWILPTIVAVFVALAWWIG